MKLEVRTAYVSQFDFRAGRLVFLDFVSTQDEPASTESRSVSRDEASMF
jgi:hypothetical protein